MRRIGAAVVLTTMVLAGLTRVGGAQGKEKEEPVDSRILAYDKGPAKIDVSKYPVDIQSSYKVFASKCTKCHTLARPINCEFALDDEWERYIKRMMRKPGSGVTAENGKAIFEFLAYDSKIRKKALYDKKMASAPKP